MIEIGPNLKELLDSAGFIIIIIIMIYVWNN